jgi:hypothetical protein
MRILNFLLTWLAMAIVILILKFGTDAVIGILSTSTGRWFAIALAIALVALLATIALRSLGDQLDKIFNP